jgi:phosphohistidine phosphatase
MRRSLRGVRVAPVTDRRRLIVMRHAKAENFAATDHERTLTDRGRGDAEAVGPRLRQDGFVPDYVVVSSAVRAVETWEAVAQTAGFVDVPVVFEEAVFNGGPHVVIDAIRVVPDDTGTVLFVGHNPAAEYLCHFLDDGEGDPEAVTGMLQGFPPAAVAVLEMRVPWSEIGPETGRVVSYFVGVGD